MNTTLFDYCKVCLADQKRKPEHKKVTNESFANFIVNARDCVEHLRKFDSEFSYKNYVEAFEFTSNDLIKLANDGLKSILSDNKNIEAKADDAEKIMHAAYCGLKSAALLLGVHLICDVISKNDIEFGGILLNMVLYQAGEDSDCGREARSLVDLYNQRYPAPYVNATDEEIYKFSRGYYVKDGKLLSADFVGELVSDRNVIGCIRFYCEWFEKPIEVFYKNDRIDVYCVPYLPLWYVFKCIYDKVGADTMNELAGVRICDEEQTEESLPPVMLRNEPDENATGLTQILGVNTYIDYHGDIRVTFESSNLNDLSHKSDEDGNWVILIPQMWNEEDLRVQRKITEYINNVMPKMAETIIPKWYDYLTEENNFPKGKCEVVLSGGGSYSENAEGGYDIKMPFDLLKMPTKVIIPYIMWRFVEEGSEAEKDIKLLNDLDVNGMTTGYANYKLLTSKFKRDCLRDKYGKKLFKK